MQTKHIVEAAVKVMSPALGASMARAAVHAHCEKLTPEGGEMTRDQFEVLLGKLAAGLTVFVGREKSAAIVDEVRRTLAGTGQPS